MAWHRTKDGSIEDDVGKVLFFSKERFVTDICLGDCCFICGAKPGSKEFNDEHVIPDWVLRKFDLFDRTITLPNGAAIKYARYKVPCCKECNSLMGRQIEERISAVVNSGPEAVKAHIGAGKGLDFFVWLGLIFLKTHLKDRAVRIVPDLRQPDDKIGDLYDWQALHHLHCIVRCFVNGAALQEDVIGSLVAFSTKSEGWSDKFDYGDLFAAQTMLLRLDDVALITTFNDVDGARRAEMPILERIEGLLSEIQAREVMVDFAFLNLSVNKRPRFYTDIDIPKEQLIEKVDIPDPFELGELDYTLRGKLLRTALGPAAQEIRFAGKTPEEMARAIDAGRITFLFDEHGKFTKQSFFSP